MKRRIHSNSPESTARRVGELFRRGGEGYNVEFPALPVRRHW
jgi:hypothetical protein